MRKEVQSKPSGDGGFGARDASELKKENQTLPNPQLTLSGAEWYSQQAHRAVNQAVGRVIRHKSDYGAILFLDSRFGEQRNQVGISKWIRPNFVADNGAGVAIGSVARFFRGARKKAAANETSFKDQKSLPQPIKLSYEAEEASNTEITKFTFIRKDRSNEDRNGDNSLLNGYVRPEQVIRQVELKDRSNPKRTNDNTDLSALKIRPARNGLNALYKPAANAGSKPNKHNLEETISSAWNTSAFQHLDSSSTRTSLGENSKPLIQKVIAKKARQGNSSIEKTSDPARQFFDLAKQILTQADFQSVFKHVISMKTYGDKKDKVSYFKAANMLVTLLQTHYDSRIGKNEHCLLELLFKILPAAYRDDIQLMASKALYEKSKLKHFCDEEVSKEELAIIERRVLALFYVDPPISDLRNIVLILMKYEKEGVISPISRLLSLIQSRRRNAVSSLIDEIISSERIKLMKKAEREKIGENGVNCGLFQNSNALLELKGPKEAVEADDEFAMREALSLASSKATDAEKKASKHFNDAFESSRQFIQKQNPYKKKTVMGTASIPVHTRPSKRAKSIVTMAQSSKSNQGIKIKEKESKISDPLDNCLRQAAADVYKQDDHAGRVARINCRLKSKGQSEMLCPICESESNEPYMAACGHYACYSCWDKWFQRSDSCPHCRKPASKQKLTRVVISEPGSASFTQLCESDEDELEIVCPKRKA